MKGRKGRNEKEEVRVKISNQKLEREKIDSKNEVTTGVSQTKQTEREETLFSTRGSD